MNIQRSEFGSPATNAESTANIPSDQPFCTKQCAEKASASTVELTAGVDFDTRDVTIRALLHGATACVSTGIAASHAAAAAVMINYPRFSGRAIRQKL